MGDRQLVVVGSVLVLVQVAPLEAEGLVTVVAEKRTPHSTLGLRCTTCYSIHGSQYQWTPSRLALPVGGTS